MQSQGSEVVAPTSVAILAQGPMGGGASKPGHSGPVVWATTSVAEARHELSYLRDAVAREREEKEWIVKRLEEAEKRALESGVQSQVNSLMSDVKQLQMLLASSDTRRRTQVEDLKDQVDQLVHNLRVTYRTGGEKENTIAELRQQVATISQQLEDQRIVASSLKVQLELKSKRERSLVGQLDEAQKKIESLAEKVSAGQTEDTRST